ncbi:MAG: hypothetical protein BJ554DRAFT_6338, partial [Olpidium bornovanus]
MSKREAGRALRKAGQESFFVLPSETLGALAICTEENEIAEFHTERQAQKPLELEPPQGTLVERLESKLAGMSDQLRQCYNALLLRLPSVMPDKLPAITLTSDAKPKSFLIYHLFKAELAEIKRQLEDLLAAGHICHSQSPWGSPVLFVKKPGRKLRVEFRQQFYFLFSLRRRFGPELASPPPSAPSSLRPRCSPPPSAELVSAFGPELASPPLLASAFRRVCFTLGPEVASLSAQVRFASGPKFASSSAPEFASPSAPNPLCLRPELASPLAPNLFRHHFGPELVLLSLRPRVRFAVVLAAPLTAVCRIRRQLLQPTHSCRRCFHRRACPRATMPIDPLDENTAQASTSKPSRGAIFSNTPLGVGYGHGGQSPQTAAPTPLNEVETLRAALFEAQAQLRRQAQTDHHDRDRLDRRPA